jgi:hypothetical protein
MDWRRCNDQFGADRDATLERVMMSWDQPIAGSGEGPIWPDRVRPRAVRKRRTVSSALAALTLTCLA